MWALDADEGHFLHRVGSDDFTELHHATVKPEALEQWEEMALEDKPPYSRAEYAAKVEALIAERYSHGKEIEVNRERESKPEAFATYMAYVEECKARAKEMLTNKPEENGEYAVVQE